MAEQEELKLTVTLVDNATAGLEKLNEQVAKLGGNTQATQRFKRENDEVASAVKKMSGGMGEAFQSLGMMRLGFAGGAAGLALFAFEMARQIAGLKEYTDKLRGFGAAARKIGVDASELKNLTDQFKNVGVEANTLITSVGKIAEAIADLQRPNSNLRKELMEAAGGDTAAMDRYIESLKSARTWAERLNIMRDAGETVYQNKLKETGSEIRARSAERMFLEKQGYDVALNALNKVKEMSEEQRRWEKERIDNATAYSNKVDEVYSKWDKIAGMFKDAAIGGWLGQATDKVNQMLDAYIKMMEAQKSEGEDLDKKYGKGSRAPGFFEFDKWFNETPEQRAREKERQIRQQQKFDTGEEPSAFTKYLREFFGDDVSAEANRRNQEQRRAIEGNTDATKGLNDTLKQLMSFSGGGAGGDGVGGGGGSMNASFSPSSAPTGSPRRFGSSAYPAVGPVETGPVRSGGGGRRRSASRGPDTDGGTALPRPGGPQARPRGAPGDAESVAAIEKGAKELGITPQEFATVMSYETIGTMSPKIWGGTGGNYLGLIQFGGPERKKYGVHAGQTFAEQTGSATAFLRDRGLKKWLEENPNATEAERQTALYSTINAGSPGRRNWGKSDRPGHTVATHARDMFAPGSRHAARARGFLAAGEQDAARAQIDKSQSNETKVTGDGNINVKVVGPRGTEVTGRATGLFKHIEIDRQIQMDKAERGPSFDQLAAQ
jgi:hypothetical protein